LGRGCLGAALSALATFLPAIVATLMTIAPAGDPVVLSTM
jgi:hypothetical protein